MRTDDELIVAIRHGETAALEELVQRHIDSVYRVALRVTGNRDDAEDVAQHAFVNAWKAIGSFRLGENFRVWIAQITRNAAIDSLRKKRDVPLSSFTQGDDEAEPFAIVDDAPSPEEHAVQYESQRHVQKLLSILPKDDQEILLLHYSDGLTFREIGEVLGAPLHTVKSRHRRALKRMQEEWERTHAPK